MCPVCYEKVDLRALYADRAWNTSNLSWWESAAACCACCCAVDVSSEDTDNVVLARATVPLWGAQPSGLAGTKAARSRWCPAALASGCLCRWLRLLLAQPEVFNMCLPSEAADHDMHVLIGASWHVTGFRCWTRSAT